MCLHRIPKETVGYNFYHRSEGKIFVAKNGSFLEKELLLKEVSGRLDDDHETSDQVSAERRRSTRVRSAPEWYGNPVLEIMLLDHDEPTNYEEAMMSQDSAKWLEAMKSEMGSMYENKVWTLVDLPDDRQAMENKWIFKKTPKPNLLSSLFESRGRDSF